MQTEPQEWHALTAEQAAAYLNVDCTHGLAAQEIKHRRAVYGANLLPAPKRKSALGIFLRQFQSPLIYILFVAAVLAFLLGERGDAAVILVVVVVNAVIGSVQEGRAERSMASLRALAVLQVRVLRDGAEQLVAASELVPGDIILLTAGDAVGADARLLDATALQAAEAAITGESQPVEKNDVALPRDTLIADRRNMLYSGTHITAGRAKAVVVASGAACEMGKIAQLTEAAQPPKTPLELRIAQFGRYLVAGALALFVAVMCIGLLRHIALSEIFMVAISQMVSMVPEGLPVAMTIALAVGMQRMAARGTIVRRLAAVETLGSTSVICSDKTGTLTRNEMTVTTVWLPDGRELEVSGVGYAPQGGFSIAGSELSAATDAALRELLQAVVLCNDAKLLPPDEQEPRWRVLGDPTEGALLVAAQKAGLDVQQQHRDAPRQAEIPFDAAAKMMATEHALSGGARRVVFKGAPEAILELCNAWRTAHQAQALDQQGRQRIASAAQALANRALRVLAVAEFDGSLQQAQDFQSLGVCATFLGLVGQIDPPRAEAGESVTQCQRAGIRPIMVTGDHQATGLAIARLLGIAKAHDRAVDGRALETMSAQQLRHELEHIAVFARVHPEQKLRIVEALQNNGAVVAMTGDGVNDAPALARADIGVAMGIIGTEVAKNAADMVITDDNFATIVKAVEQGRVVYRNLKKVILYLIATSLAEITVLLGALLLGYPLPLAAVQILWINIVTEGTVTVNLIMEPPEGDEMKQRPIPTDEPLLSRNVLQRVVLMTPTMALSTLGYFMWHLAQGVDYTQVQTETFTVLAVCQWFNVLNCQSATRSALRLGILRNRWLLSGLVLGVVLQLAVVYWPPLNTLFHTVPIVAVDLIYIVAVASLVLWVEELRKLLIRRRATSGAENQR